MPLSRLPPLPVHAGLTQDLEDVTNISTWGQANRLVTRRFSAQHVDRDELCRVLPGSSRDDISAMFPQLGEDGSGIISNDELAIYAKNVAINEIQKAEAQIVNQAHSSVPGASDRPSTRLYIGHSRG